MRYEMGRVGDYISPIINRPCGPSKEAEFEWPPEGGVTLEGGGLGFFLFSNGLLSFFFLSIYINALCVDLCEPELTRPRGGKL